MSAFIDSPNLSRAWVEAADYLLLHGGSAVNLAVSFDRPIEDPAVRLLVDNFVTSTRAAGPKTSIYPIQTVANTIFPNSLYRPALGDRALDHIIALHRESLPVRQRLRQKVQYFDRLVAWPDSQENQLETTIARLRKQIASRIPLSSAYEIGISHPSDSNTSDDTHDLRVQAPGRDRSVRGFPCLSHISLTLESRNILHLSAMYRNQHFLQRAYGNYLGLSRLLCFIAEQVSAEPGGILCLATHADLGSGALKGASMKQIRRLLADCKRGSTQCSSSPRAQRH